MDNNENVQKSGQVSILLDACDKLRADLAAALEMKRMLLDHNNTLTADLAEWKAEAQKTDDMIIGLSSDLAAATLRADAAQEELRKAREQVPVAWQFMYGVDKPSDDVRLTEPKVKREMFRELYAAPVPAQPQPSWNVCKHCLNTRKEAQPQPAPYKGWYCAHCQTGVDSREVTFSEQHTVCGRVITDDEPPAPEGTCAWSENDDGFYETECGNSFQFSEGGAADNGAVYCQYCGKKIDEHWFDDMPEGDTQ